ncbi:MAG: type II toxin-antitoxin system RelE/ParE family toxin [Deltaproteobacteria bacterium]|nr:type II toxin-antitoxin system RelE/ParE family toxin [Deltaproteobacteria bacterium]
MAWDIEYADEFEKWWEGLTEEEQIDIDAVIGLLEIKGPLLGFPYSSGIQRSKHGHMRELRIQHKGEPYRILYAFDPRRAAILLVGGCKGGDDRWYDKHIPIADKLYDVHLQTLKRKKKGGL